MNLTIDALATSDTSAFVFQEIEQIIQETLSSLSPQCRKVFEMSRLQEMKNREIAENLNISVRTVEGHISKGIKTLKIALKDYSLVAHLFCLKNQCVMRIDRLRKKNEEQYRLKVLFLHYFLCKMKFQDILNLVTAIWTRRKIKTLSRSMPKKDREIFRKMKIAWAMFLPAVTM